MAVHAYTLPLWRGAVTGGEYDSPVVPSATVWVVRHIVMQVGGIVYRGGTIVQFSINNTYPLAGWLGNYTEGAQYYYWEGRQSLLAGEKIHLHCAGAGVGFAITGYVLTA
jgi:hypothetical protein